MRQVIRTRHYQAGRASRIEVAMRPAAAMRRGVSSAVALLLLSAWALMPLRVSAVNLGFLGNSPISMMQPADVDLMRKNAQEVLDSAQPNAKQAWSNAKTGASGFAQVTGTFTMADGTLCKRLRIFNRAGGLENVGVYPVCKYSGRGWVINADAQAPK